VFPFSPRKGTPAFHFSPRVDSRIIRERCAVLREMGKIKKKKFAVANLAKRVEALVQNTRDQQTGFLKAVTSNYLFVLLPPEPELRGKIIDIIPKECNSFGTLKGMPVG
jgi:threonylcarbamoyladenosine tRNA methylthiotransferase MtaB